MSVRYVPTNRRSNKGEGLYSELTYVVNCPPTAPIELMIRAMAFQGGGVLQLGPFTYTIRGTLNIVTTVSIHGIPGATKIKKIDGNGPTVRVFGGAKIRDCIIERNAPVVAYTADQNPTRPWENSVVHLCEPVLEYENFKHDATASAQDGWQATLYGAATIEGCGINTRASKTRGVYVDLYGVTDSNDIEVGSGYLNASVINNTIIPLASPVHSCVYFAEGTYNAVCLGNICTAGNQTGTIGRISYRSTASNYPVALGRSSGATNPPREESNVATYNEY